MLNTLGLKTNTKRDQRFVDPERNKSGKERAMNVAVRPHNDRLFQDGLYNNIVPDWAGSQSGVHITTSTSAVQTDVNILEVANENFRRQQRSLFKEKNDRGQGRTLRRSRKKGTSVIHEFPFEKVREAASRKQAKEAVVEFSYHPDDFVSSVGVFSDTRSYSALIKNELRKHRVNLKHFHHPHTFKSGKFEYFDKIEAWLLFLSEDCNEEFIDKFISRYADKPALFLCPKMRRVTASEKIASFLNANELGG